jgi:hypothetical protein
MSVQEDFLRDIGFKNLLSMHFDGFQGINSPGNRLLRGFVPGYSPETPQDGRS